MSALLASMPLRLELTITTPVRFASMSVRYIPLTFRSCDPVRSAFLKFTFRRLVPSNLENLTVASVMFAAVSSVFKKVTFLISEAVKSENSSWAFVKLVFVIFEFLNSLFDTFAEVKLDFLIVDPLRSEL